MAEQLSQATPTLRDFEHEEIIVRQDAELGLTAVIAIHDTTLGPAAGGCRCWHYGSLDDAILDAARLSEGMTYKNAIADIGFGGGKSVILAPPGGCLSRSQLHQFGQWIEALGGRYITAEDVGMGVASMRAVAEHTQYVSGLSTDGAGGDPSPYTALGVFRGLQAAVRHRLASDSLAGVRVAVQGLGSVGMRLAEFLHDQRAVLYVADPDQRRVDHAVASFGASAVPVDDIVAAPVDVFAPCALGGVLTETSIRTLQATVIAGAANNQLATPAVGDSLQARGVLYAPDYVINAGGVISVAAEYRGQFDREVVLRKVNAIYDSVLGLFERSDRENRATQAVARDMASVALAAGAGSPANAAA